jgi:adenylosuccinate synthase
MPNIVVVGAQWGDEGKGKIVDLLTERFDIVARCQGGHNAGHTVIIGGEKFVLHLIPSGILRPDKICVIGNGVIVDPFALISELDSLQRFEVPGRLFVSNRCHLIMPYHNAVEAAEEKRLGERRIGTTSRGIGPCYEDKVARRGIRIGDLRYPDLFADAVRENVAFKNRVLSAAFNVGPPIDPEPIVDSYLGVADIVLPYVADTSGYLNRAIRAGKSVLFEGAQGTLLDVDFGTYPFVTSSNATAGGACTGTGVGPSVIDGVVGISKAYTTRVGGGPFPTELDGELGERLRLRGAEFGASTGRPRRCGWFDAVVGRYSRLINGLDSLVVTKLDVLDEMEEIRICTAYRHEGSRIEDFPSCVEILDRVEPVYEVHPGWMTPTSGIREYSKLPEKARSYLRRLAELVETDVCLISTGPDRRETIPVPGNSAFPFLFGE